MRDEESEDRESGEFGDAGIGLVVVEAEAAEGSADFGFGFVDHRVFHHLVRRLGDVHFFGLMLCEIADAEFAGFVDFTGDFREKLIWRKFSNALKRGAPSITCSERSRRVPIRPIKWRCTFQAVKNSTGAASSARARL